MNKPIIFSVIIFFLTTAIALTPAEEVSQHINYWILVFYCMLIFIIGAVSALVIILSGVKLLTTQDIEERKEAKKRLKYALIALIFILIVCPLVNYLIHDFKVGEFVCNCPPTAPP